VRQTRGDWEAMAATLAPQAGAFVDGRYAPAASGRTFPSVNPATGATVAEVASCDAADVDRAVAAARAAFESGAWSRTDPAQRRRVLLRLAELVDAHADELGLLDSLEMGKAIADAVGVDVPEAAAVFAYYAEAVDKVTGEVAATGPGDLALVTRVPLGVVGAITPWNFPLPVVAWKVAPALASGNSVVLKPSEESSLSAIRLGALASEAGLPDGVLNVVPGLGEEAGAALGRHLDVDCVAFTGSGVVGRLLLGYAAASNMKPVWVECGGKSPNLIFHDADVAAAAEKASWGAFVNQGEICSANSRILVDRRVKDEFVAELARHARALEPRHPLEPEAQMGALVSAEHTAAVLAYVEEGRQAGTLVLGGERRTIEGSDCYVEPTIFDGVPPTARVATEEVFGPVACVFEFDAEEEAIALANATQYGLAASVWTNDLARAHRVAGRLQVGTVSVNTVDALSVQVPFGGFKQSGFGRDLSLHALEKYTGLKTTWIKLG
jgi:4-(gamma-glutamylamino)butanal dehydrogenase